MSSGGRIEHMVNVTVPEQSQFIFVSSSGMQIDPQDEVLVSPIPMQDTLDESMTQALESAA